MFHIVASDLDGTLLSPDHRLTIYTKKTLQSLTARGINFVFATGRHHIDVAQIRDNLAINAYMITSNGARVHNPSGKLVFSHNIDKDIALELFKIAHEDPKILTNVFRKDTWFINRNRTDQENFFRESIFNYQIYKQEDLSGNEVCKVYYTSDNYTSLMMLENTLNSRWGNRINVSFSMPVCLEVMAGGVSKGRALDRVAKLLGYSLNDCIAFGDGMNDKEMLKMAGKGCIMKNAQQRLKNLLPELEIIGTNKDEGVPNYLCKMYLISK